MMTGIARFVADPKKIATGFGVSPGRKDAPTALLHVKSVHAFIIWQWRRPPRLDQIPFSTASPASDASSAPRRWHRGRVVGQHEGGRVGLHELLELLDEKPRRERAVEEIAEEQAEAGSRGEELSDALGALLAAHGVWPQVPFVARERDGVIAAVGSTWRI
jgi:hypothetical protein